MLLDSSTSSETLSFPLTLATDQGPAQLGSGYHRSFPGQMIPKNVISGLKAGLLGVGIPKGSINSSAQKAFLGYECSPGLGWLCITTKKPGSQSPDFGKVLLITPSLPMAYRQMTIISNALSGKADTAHAWFTSNPVTAAVVLSEAYGLGQSLFNLLLAQVKADGSNSLPFTVSPISSGFRVFDGTLSSEVEEYLDGKRNGDLANKLKTALHPSTGETKVYIKEAFSSSGSFSPALQVLVMHDQIAAMVPSGKGVVKVAPEWAGLVSSRLLTSMGPNFEPLIPTLLTIMLAENRLALNVNRIELKLYKDLLSSEEETSPAMALFKSSSVGLTHVIPNFESTSKLMVKLSSMLNFDASSVGLETMVKSWGPTAQVWAGPESSLAVSIAMFALYYNKVTNNGKASYVPFVVRYLGNVSQPYAILRLAATESNFSDLVTKGTSGITTGYSVLKDVGARCSLFTLLAKLSNS